MRYSQKRACRHHLRTTFGLQEYRPGQKEAVKALLSGRDLMCILPTGAGKSLCWQLPAVVHEGLTVVVSPLIALMRDQVQHLHAAGVPALSLDSLMSGEEKSMAMDAIRRGMVKIVYVSPERLEQTRFRQLCRELKPWLIVVDEAHCAVQWGDSFRPAYTGIRDFISSLPHRPVLCALTATADKAMQQAIQQSLGIRRTKRILLPIVRENLVYEVRTTLNTTADILSLCQNEPCKTVVFCRSRARTEQLARLLAGRGVSAECYHAGLDRETRVQVQDRFMTDETQVLCATTAFGLGVDIPDIRLVVHDYLPDQLIDYVQQSGRAGRDGAEAKCLLLLEPNELVRKAAYRSYDKGLLTRVRKKRKYYRGIKLMLRVLMQEKCIAAGIAGAFGKRVGQCGVCCACRNGALVKRVPGAELQSKNRMRLWVLSWQREALARRLGCRPGAIVPDHALNSAARRLTFPCDVRAPEALERLLAHFRHDMDA